ncbi:hypothetical protein CO674_10000 [Rhizobium hidalgonense]|uniref:Uncharacterized protein n=1 Tax=Rhizobium hidalgonense TaxID=1538159 RepID=A0ABX4JY79_9HYPH|nr:hypothetical protein CO674_10000 [Rhizobium hidalgonense]PON03997.1 hypothetical protein ATY29_29805 [Rhizobium hidalgonense]
MKALRAARRHFPAALPVPTSEHQQPRQPAPPIGLTIWRPAKSFSLSDTTTQPFATATAVLRIQSRLQRP